MGGPETSIKRSVPRRHRHSIAKPLSGPRRHRHAIAKPLSGPRRQAHAIAKPLPGPLRHRHAIAKPLSGPRRVAQGWEQGEHHSTDPGVTWRSLGPTWRPMVPRLGSLETRWVTTGPAGAQVPPGPVKQSLLACGRGAPLTTSPSPGGHLAPIGTHLAPDGAPAGVT